MNDPASVPLRAYSDPWPSAQERWQDINRNTFNDWVTSGASNGRFSYAVQPNVILTYDRLPGGRYFVGRIDATGLKPNFAYQLKLLGKPTYGSRGMGTTQPYVDFNRGIHGTTGAINGDDWANEQLGYVGRWWDDNNQAPGTNLNDSYYLAYYKNPVLTGQPAPQGNAVHSVYGYHFMGSFVTGSTGEAHVDFDGRYSYHIDWASWQSGIRDVLHGSFGVQGSLVTSSPLLYYGYGGTTPSPATVTLYYEYEAARTNPVVLVPGDYHCRFMLTEESFHAGGGVGGYWKSVLATEDFGSGGQPDTDPVNDVVFRIGHAPVASDLNLSTITGSAVAATLGASDADLDALTYTTATGPAHGALSGTAPTLTYTPNAGYAGVDSFTFRAGDGAFQSAPATVSIDVAEPASLVVTVADDIVDAHDAATSLREAITFANSGNAGVAPAVTFALSAASTVKLGGAITLTHNITITGPGQSLLGISGEQRGLVFNITGGVAALSGLTLLGGRGATEGGGIVVAEGATLTMSDCTVRDCISDFGGGGAILGKGTVSLIRCTVRDNSVSATATEAYGGGICNQGELTITGSTISGNASDYGAGIYNQGALLLINSTVSANSAVQGGGVAQNGASMILANCTISGNSASTSGGGLWAMGASPVAAINTIIAGNSAVVAATADLDGKLTLGTGTSCNIVGVAPAPGAVTSGADGTIAGVDWKTVLEKDGTIPTLTANGGLTNTIALEVGSPAINGGDDSVLAAPYNLVTDQRGTGFPRKLGSRVDVGAYEAQSNVVPVANVQAVTVTRNTATTITLTASDAEGDPLIYRLAARPMAGARIYNGGSTASPLIGSGAALPFKLNGNQITYLPAVGYTGSDAFTFKVFDGQAYSATATITITVAPPVPPDVTISHPTVNQILVDTPLTLIDGTMVDNSEVKGGINKVQVYLFHANPAGAGLEYYSGGQWRVYATSSAAIAANATLNANVTGNTWTCAGGLPSGLLATGTYTVRAYAVDNQGSTSSAATTIFQVRSGPPTVTITQPVANQLFKDTLVTTIQGTVIDRGPDHSGIDRVVLFLYRANSSGTGYQYWNGSAWVAYATSTAANAAALATSIAGNTTTGGTWTCTAQLPGTLLPTGNYLLRAFAIDRHGLVGPTVYAAFKTQSGAPVTAFSHPLANQQLGSAPLSGIDGTVLDNSPDHVGINTVILNFYRPRTGGGFEYWTGSGWKAFANSTAAVAGGGALPTTVVNGTTWSTTATLPLRLESGAYYLRAYAVNNSGLAGVAVGRSFSSSGPGGAPGIDNSGYSTAIASVATGSVTLTFRTALDAASASEAAHYGVAVNDQPAVVWGVAVSGSRVTLALEGGLRAGDRMQVAWSDLRTSAGRTLTGATTTLTAQ